MLGDEVDVHRLVWSPDDFDGENLLTTAFRKEDLSGGVDDYVSVSRTDSLDPKAEIALAHTQAEKFREDQFRRDVAWSVLYNCGDLRRAKDIEGATPFDVTPEPILGENEAHCGIRNTTDHKGKAYINQLRLMLVDLAKPRRELNDFLADYGRS